MKRNFCGTMLTGAVLASSMVLISACGPKTETTGDVTVKIKFKDKCPDSVDKDNKGFTRFEVDRTDRLTWQASDTTVKYKIYFDPFNGEPLVSDDTGKLIAPEFNSLSPAAEYKYTIVAEGDECLKKEKKSLDPRFRLR